ncbi:Nucleoplasmin-like protein, partial [Pseudolycoriella hygida]
MAEEFFYGVTLSNSGASVTWDPENKDEFPNNYKLIIKQILLDHEAKENEFNVVEVEVMSSRDKIKIPIAVLKVGETRSVRTDLEFPEPPVTFKLIMGNGPVHIHGQHVPGAVVEEIEDYGEEMEEEILDEEDADEEEEDDTNPKKKVKLSNNAKGGTKAVNVKNIKKK